MTIQNVFLCSTSKATTELLLRLIIEQVSRSSNFQRKTRLFTIPFLKLTKQAITSHFRVCNFSIDISITKNFANSTMSHAAHSLSNHKILGIGTSERNHVALCGLIHVDNRYHFDFYTRTHVSDSNFLFASTLLKFFACAAK